MTTGYISLTSLISAKIMADKANLDTARIKDLIQSDSISPLKVQMSQGVRYYQEKHDILDHKNYYYADGEKREDTAKSNSRLVHSFFKILVDQKVSYLVGNPLVLSIAEPDVKDPNNPTPKEESVKAETEKFQERLLDQIGNFFDDVVNDWILGASKKGVEWIHFYIDSRGDFHYCILPAEQIIAIYDTQYEQELVYVVRYYMYDIVNENGEINQRKKVEWWTKDSVEYWQETLEGIYVHDPFYDLNPAPHWVSEFDTAGVVTKESHGWGRLPFVRLDNNTDCRSDLGHSLKSLIDAYDLVKSGWVNDLVDFQELIYVLKGYSALTNESQKGLTELAAFMVTLKSQKVISVEADGAVTTLKAEIPVEAKEKFLDITRKEIFYFGEGIDVNNENFRSPSGVALKFLYASLDLKCSIMERKLKKALSDFMWFIVERINQVNRTSYDSSEVLFTVNKAVIFNEKEKIDGLVASEPILSKRTILENHPYVDDVDEEQKRLDAEEQDRLDKNMVDLANVVPAGENPAPGTPPVPGQPPMPQRVQAPARRNGEKVPVPV